MAVLGSGGLVPHSKQALVFQCVGCGAFHLQPWQSISSLRWPVKSRVRAGGEGDSPAKVAPDPNLTPF